MSYYEGASAVRQNDFDEFFTHNPRKIGGDVLHMEKMFSPAKMEVLEKHLEKVKFDIVNNRPEGYMTPMAEQNFNLGISSLEQVISFVKLARIHLEREE